MKNLAWMSLVMISMARLAAANCVTMSNGLGFSGPTPNDAVMECESSGRAQIAQCQENVRCGEVAPEPEPYSPYPTL